MRVVWLLVIWLSLCSSALGADNAAGLWIAVSRAGTLASGPDPGPWRYAVQGRLRSLDRAGGTRQVAFRPGFSYRVNGKITLAGGYAYFYTDSQDLGMTTEHRAWQQIDWNMVYWSRVALKSRTRLEQRFLEDRDGTGWWLRQRFMVAQEPLHRNNLEWLYGVEGYVNLVDTHWSESGYTRSRLLGGLGFRLGKAGIEALYVYEHNQIRDRPDLVSHWLVFNIKL